MSLGCGYAAKLSTRFVSPVTRRADPDRIHVARRNAIRNSLMDVGIAQQAAEEWCDRWEAEAERRGLERGPDYWKDGRKWIWENKGKRVGGMKRLLVLAFLVAGCAEVTVAPATVRPVAQVTPPPASPQLYHPDETVTVSHNSTEWARITVSRVNEETSYSGAFGGDTSGAGNVYIEMFVTYEAIAPTVSYNPFEWQIFVDDVAVSGFALVANGPEPALGSGTLPAGRRAEGWLVYEVPKAGRVVLSWGANPFSNQPPVFEYVLRDG
jgi:hypothetical protein